MSATEESMSSRTAQSGQGSPAGGCGCGGHGHGRGHGYGHAHGQGQCGCGGHGHAHGSVQAATEVSDLHAAGAPSQGAPAPQVVQPVAGGGAGASDGVVPGRKPGNILGLRDVSAARGGQDGHGGCGCGGH